MSQSLDRILDRLLAWRRKYVSEQNFILIVSALVGVASGFAAVLLKETVHFIQHSLSSTAYHENYFQLLYPIVGLLLTVLLAKVLYKETLLGHAITDILYSISKKSSIIEKSKMYSRMVTSAFTVGFGGSAGLESPIVLTGSAIGSNIGRVLHLNYKMRTLMIGCGTAGVISAIFNAPITGLIFSIEVILAEVTVSKFIPLLIASVTATLVSLGLLGEDILFSFKLVDTFHAMDVPLFIGLGVVCGFTSMYFLFILHKTEHLFDTFKGNNYSKALLGGGLISVLIFICPPVYGEGYTIIKALLTANESILLDRSVLFNSFHNNWLFLIYIIIIVLVKPITSSITIGAGGSGGTFAPALFLGGLTGFAFARFVNLTELAQISEVNFTLVGMCGVLCGIQYAPLTAIFLIAEITGGYTLFVPLMLVSAIAFSTVSYFNPHSPYIRELIHRGDYTRGDQDKTVLSTLNIHKLIETDLKKVHQDAMLMDLVKLISVSKRNIFPVIDDKERMVGVVTLDNVRDIMFDPEKQQNVRIKDEMETPPATVEYEDDMQTVMKKFESTGAWNLPVLEKGKYRGFVSKSKIFGYYREQLIEQNKDENVTIQ